MLSHTTAIAPEGGPAILAAIGIAPAHARPLTYKGLVDRELMLSVSDAFSRQTWLCDGQVRRETRDTLLLATDEHIRITVSNDMPGVRVVSVGDDRLLRIRSGASASIDVKVGRQGRFAIQVVGEPTVSRAACVQGRRRPQADAA